MSEDLSIDTEKVIAASNTLVGFGDVIYGISAKSRDHVPEIPEDFHDLLRLIREFEDRRSEFDRLMSDTLQSSGGKLASCAMAALAADSSRPVGPMPGAASSDVNKGR